MTDDDLMRLAESIRDEILCDEDRTCLDSVEVLTLARGCVDLLYRPPSMASPGRRLAGGASRSTGCVALRPARTGDVGRIPLSGIDVVSDIGIMET